jgi:TolA-binding protein
MLQEGYNTEDSEQSLFNVGEYYLKNSRFSQAEYVFGRYLTYYPSGKNAAEAVKRLQILRDREVSMAASHTPGTEQDGAAAKAYYDAVSYISQGKFPQALGALKKILAGAGDSEYRAKSSYEVGHCLFMMHKFDECIQHFSDMLSTYPQHPKQGDALFSVAQSYESLERKDMAEIFYKSLLSIIPNGEDPLQVKAKKALAALGRA